MRTISYIATILLLLSSINLYAEPHCGGNLRTPMGGPFDYTSFEDKTTLELVEWHHFSKNVENLISGSTGAIAGDLHFVLMQFPNHHRALLAMSRLSVRDKVSKPEGAVFTTLCYFERAIRFKPNAATIRSIFSSHLLNIGKFDMALEQLNIASNLDPGNPAISYNLGLLYFQKKDYDKSVLFAKKAYSQNFPLPGLKNKLTNIGRWKK